MHVVINNHLRMNQAFDSTLTKIVYKITLILQCSYQSIRTKNQLIDLLHNFAWLFNGFLIDLTVKLANQRFSASVLRTNQLNNQSISFFPPVVAISQHTFMALTSVTVSFAGYIIKDPMTSAFMDNFGMRFFSVRYRRGFHLHTWSGTRRMDNVQHRFICLLTLKCSQKRDQ